VSIDRENMEADMRTYVLNAIAHDSELKTLPLTTKEFISYRLVEGGDGP